MRELEPLPLVTGRGGGGGGGGRDVGSNVFTDSTVGGVAVGVVWGFLKADSLLSNSFRCES